MATLPPLPAGFTIDNQGSTPPLPAGFSLDSESGGSKVDLQDLLIQQAKGVPGLEGQIAQLRQQTNSPDTDRSVSGFEQVQTEAPLQTDTDTGAQIGFTKFGVPDFGLESAGRGFKQGLLNVGSGALGAGAKALDAVGVDTGQFQQDLEASRSIDLQRTKQLTADSPIAGTLGEIAGEVAALPFPAAKTIKTAATLGAGTGALVAEGTDRDPVTGALIGGIAGGTLKKVEKVVRSKIADREKIAKLLKEGSADVSTATSKLDSVGNVIEDKTAKEVIKQGVDETLVAGVKQANSQTKRKMVKSLKILQSGKKNVTEESVPTDTIGKSVLDRVKITKADHLKQGAELDKVARSLDGKVDMQPTINGLVDNLKKLDVTFTGPRNKLNFNKSAIEGLAAPEKIIKQVVGRVKRTDLSNPVEAHKFKNFLDELLTSGKSQKEGLTGKTINVIEQLRKGVDGTLDKAFPKYNAINTKWSQSKKALDGFQDLLGKKVDIFSEAADGKLGKILNRTVSNAASRSTIIQSIKDVDKVAKAAGSKLNDDILLQVKFADQMEKLFKTSPGRSLQGQVGRAVDIPTSTSAVGLELAKAGVNKLKGVNEDAAFESIMRLLRETE